MGIREKLNEKPGLTAGVVGAIVVIAIVWTIYSTRSPSVARIKTQNMAFYTEDDGETYYPGDYTGLARDVGANGKPAARACVFQYGSEKPFVAWMEKYTDAGKQTLIRFYSIAANLQKAPPEALDSELLVKKPGGKTWISMRGNAGQAKEIRTVTAKGGQEAKAVRPT